jgi:hypothetical protein
LYDMQDDYHLGGGSYGFAVTGHFMSTYGGDEGPMMGYGMPEGPHGGGGPRVRSVGCHSFSPDTLVLMADGHPKAIADIEIGDEVVVTDPVTGENVTEPVVRLHKNLDVDLIDVTVMTVDGDRVTIHTTQHHPFWDDTAGAWVEAAGLPPGHMLHTVSGNAELVVGSRNFTAARSMYDLTVAEIHTYYIFAGKNPVLVHNCPVWSSRQNRTSVENAYEHYGDHGGDFPRALNALKYVQEAHDFLHNPPSGALTKTRTNGDTVVFDPSTDRFGVMNASGAPKTYFIPDPAVHGYPTNLDYYNAQ